MPMSARRSESDCDIPPGHHHAATDGEDMVPMTPAPEAPAARKEEDGTAKTDRAGSSAGPAPHLRARWAGPGVVYPQSGRRAFAQRLLFALPGGALSDMGTGRRGYHSCEG